MRRSPSPAAVLGSTSGDGSSSRARRGSQDRHLRRRRPCARYGHHRVALDARHGIRSARRDLDRGAHAGPHARDSGSARGEAVDAREQRGPHGTWARTSTTSCARRSALGGDPARGSRRPGRTRRTWPSSTQDRHRRAGARRVWVCSRERSLLAAWAQDGLFPPLVAGSPSGAGPGIPCETSCLS